MKVAATGASSKFAVGGERLCGAGRMVGGVYLECAPVPGGVALERFLIDPPQPIEVSTFGIALLGVNLLTRAGVTHVIDWVGESHYPEMQDFIEEGRVMGFARKVSAALDFSRLSANSRLLFLHARARVDNAPALSPFTPDFKCPCGNGHSALEPCIGYGRWTAATTGGGRRVIGSLDYPVHSLQHGAPPLQFNAALFLSIPLTGISVIRGDMGGLEALLLKVAQAGVPTQASSS